jgi:hypothetical protein
MTYILSDTLIKTVNDPMNCFMKPVGRDGNYFVRRFRQFVTCEIIGNNCGCILLRGKLTRRAIGNLEYGCTIELVAVGEMYDVCICLF